MNTATAAPFEDRRLGDYRLVEQLGVGGAAEVWLGENYYTGIKAAIKICRDPAVQEALRNEARRLGDLLQASQSSEFSPYVVRLLETRLGETPPSIVMEYCPGGDLRSVIGATDQLDEVAVEHILKQMLTGLAWAHDRNIIHRDIKPENILFASEFDPARPEDATVKVGDFGLGRPAEEALLSVHRSQNFTGQDLGPGHGTSSGTLEYMSPEQMEGGDLSKTSDIYAVGIVLFEMLTGRRPRGRIVPSSLRPGIDSKWDRLFERCYAFAPADRFESAGAMLEALDRKVAFSPAAKTKLSPSARAAIESEWTEREKNELIRIADGIENSDVLTLKEISKRKEMQTFLVSNERKVELAHANLYTGFDWPEREDPKVDVRRRQLKITWRVLIALLVLSVIPLTSWATFGLEANTILGMIVIFVVAQYFFSDLLYGAEGKEKKTRLTVRSPFAERAVVTRIQPHSLQKDFVEIRSGDDQLTGFIDMRKPNTPIIHDEGMNPLYRVTYERQKRRNNIPTRPRHRRCFAVRRLKEGRSAAPLAEFGFNKRDGGLLWFNPESAEAQNRKQLLASVGFSLELRSRAGW